MRTGDEVTVQPIDGDPHLLHYQRYATVRHIDHGMAYVSVPCSIPPHRPLGPIPVTRLLPGWKNEKGEWRRW